MANPLPDEGTSYSSSNIIEAYGGQSPSAICRASVSAITLGREGGEETMNLDFSAVWLLHAQAYM